MSENPGRLKARTRLLQKRRARKKINIRIEDRDEHAHRTAQGADIRQEVVLCAPAGPGAQRRLQRAGKLEKVGVDVGHDVGRRRDRQNQRPFEPAPAGKPAPTGQPRTAHTNQRYAHAYAQGENQGIPQIPRQNRSRQMRPGIAARHEQVQHDHTHGHRDQQCGRQRTAAQPRKLDPRQRNCPPGG